MKRVKHHHLLEDKAIKRWYDDVARGSEITVDVYLRRLGAFCIENYATPQAFASMSSRKSEELLMDYITAKEKMYAGSYLESTFKALKSWLTSGSGYLGNVMRILAPIVFTREQIDKCIEVMDASLKAVK